MVSIGREVSETAALYDRVASSYQRWWAPVIEPAALQLLDLAAPVVEHRPDAVIVDVGAGTGTVARAAVARWPNVRAIAVDPSAGMLDLGRTIASASLDPSAGRRLDWLTADAEHLPLPDGSVDAVLSSFTFQYVPHRTAALREAWRALRPGGALAVVTWLANDLAFVPWQLFDEVLRELRVERPPSREPGIFRTLPSAAALFRRAGFRDVRATDGVVEHQWAADALVHCTLELEERELVDRLEDTTRDRLRRLWAERLALASDADLHYRDVVAYVTGRRPAS